MKVTVYKRPNGHAEVIDCKNIRPDDARWFESNGVNVSMEDIGGDIVLYADIGKTINDDPDEDPAEVIVFAMGRSCEAAMAELRGECESELSPEEK